LVISWLERRIWQALNVFALKQIPYEGLSILHFKRQQQALSYSAEVGNTHLHMETTQHSRSPWRRFLVGWGYSDDYTASMTIFSEFFSNVSRFVHRPLYAGWCESNGKRTFATSGGCLSARHHS